MATQTTINEVNGIDIDVLQTTVKNIQNDPDLGKCRFHVRNQWLEGNHNKTTITSFYGAKQENEHEHPFELDADEPPVLAGHDQAPNPVEHLLNALAGCVTTSMVAHAAVRGIRIHELESEIEGHIDLRGFLGIAPDVPKGYTDIRMKFKVNADTDDMEKLKKLAEYSPVYNTLIGSPNVEIQVEPK
ncbi:MAG: OsmC family protein [Sedimentisphaerales bacterium]|nr:OsmC family protein [Sedimentisphaerales bacterium]